MLTRRYNHDTISDRHTQEHTQVYATFDLKAHSATYINAFIAPTLGQTFTLAPLLPHLSTLLNSCPNSAVFMEPCSHTRMCNTQTLHILYQLCHTRVYTLTVQVVLLYVAMPTNAECTHWVNMHISLCVCGGAGGLEFTSSDNIWDKQVMRLTPTLPHGIEWKISHQTAVQELYEVKNWKKCSSLPRSYCVCISL